MTPAERAYQDAWELVNSLGGYVPPGADDEYGRALDDVLGFIETRQSIAAFKARNGPRVGAPEQLHIKVMRDLEAEMDR